jgi:hypothetical protein
MLIICVLIPWGFTIFGATYLQSNGEKIQIIQEIFTTIANDAKASCLNI